MAMDEARRQAVTEERFARWRARLAEVHATPIILIGVSPRGDGPLHIFVPHNDAVETALMVETFRRIADELEAHGPQVYGGGQG
jgi:hypothetical protein